MSDSKASKRDAAPPRKPRRQHEAPPSLADRRRQIRREVETFAGAVQDTTGDVRRYLADQTERRPYRSLGVAVAIGYVLGGGLTSRFTALSLAAASRLAMALAVRQLGAWIVQGGSGAPQKRVPENIFGPAKE